MAVALVDCSRRSAEVEPIVWYGIAPHPYITEVRSGVEALERETGVKIAKTVGQEWKQDNENVNVEALSTRGHRGFSIYPGDAAGANGLFRQLRGRGQIVVAYGAEPALPTPAAMTVATDIKAAAMLAAEKLIELIGGRGRILNVLETVTDVNTRLRDDGIKEVVGRHPGVEIVQTISDTTQVSEASTKIQSALAARAGEIDGMIATGYNPTVAAASILTEWHRDPAHKRIRFIGIDTAGSVLQAIRDGSIDATIAQNPRGHGYVSTLALGGIHREVSLEHRPRLLLEDPIVVTKKSGERWRLELTLRVRNHGRYGEPQLREMVEQYRTHPSVVVWSVGNEFMAINEYFGLVRAEHVQRRGHARPPAFAVATAADPGQRVRRRFGDRPAEPCARLLPPAEVFWR
jgi:ribose transport system substrate-binding protein